MLGLNEYSSPTAYMSMLDTLSEVDRFHLLYCTMQNLIGVMEYYNTVPLNAQIDLTSEQVPISTNEIKKEALILPNVVLPQREERNDNTEHKSLDTVVRNLSNDLDLLSNDALKIHTLSASEEAAITRAQEVLRGTTDNSPNTNIHRRLTTLTMPNDTQVLPVPPINRLLTLEIDVPPPPMDNDNFPPLSAANYAQNTKYKRVDSKPTKTISADTKKKW
jgi:hypothetical protein